MARINLGNHIDKLFLMKLEIDREEVKIKKLKDKYEKVREAVYNKVSKEDLDGGKGKLAKVSLVRTESPSIEDFDKFFKFVIRNKSKDLIARKVNSKAWRERLEAGKKVPGVEKFVKITMRLSKI